MMTETFSNLSPSSDIPSVNAEVGAREAEHSRPLKDEQLSDLEDLVVGIDGKARPAWAAEGMLKHYYDTEWGLPVWDERDLFERLSLEVFQRGLSWITVLRKREALRAAFANFKPDAVANFTRSDIERMLEDKTIIRNRAKITATITNARATIRLRDQEGLAKLVWSFKPSETPYPRTLADIPKSSKESSALSVALHKHGFKFVGPTNMYAMMEALGLVDTHLLGSYRRGSSGVWL
jgi:DNA-3-methyladenine glycosylase I